MLPSNTKLKPKQKCQTPGCDYPNFHVCLVGKPDTFPQLLGETQKKTGGNSLGERTQEHRDAIAEGQKRRWAKVHERERERNEIIVQTYEEGDRSIREVALLFGVSKDKVMRLLKASDADVREPGLNIMHGAG